MTMKNVAASIRGRLLEHAKATNQDFNLLLTRYALERLLHRLSTSPQADRFCLKGALLFTLWFDLPHRPTQDLDLLAMGPADEAQLAALFQALCATPASDGLVFSPESVQVSEIRKAANYPGLRVTLRGTLDGARCAIQVDVGFGDAITPGVVEVTYPVILTGMDAPKLRAYPPETVVAEKLHALATLGMANTRLKDAFDLWVLANHGPFEEGLLQRAVQATFARRGSPLPESVPLGLSDAFAQAPDKTKQWAAFLRKNRLDAPPLAEVMAMLRSFGVPLWLPTESPSEGQRVWRKGGPWAPSRASSDTPDTKHPAT